MKEWYREFFDELYYETYRPREPEERNRKEAEFIARALELPKGAKILDIGCGYARHAVYLARMGYRVVGIDISDYLLEKAKERVKEFGVEVTLMKKDMRELDYREEFDGAYMFFTTFGYFSHEENQEVLMRVARALKPGGRFLVDITNKYKVIENFVRSGGQHRTWYKAGEYVVLEEMVFDIEKEEIISKRIFVKGDRVVASRAFTLKVYSYSELKTMLERAGLKPVKVFGDYEGKPFKINSPRLIIVAERR